MAGAEDVRFGPFQLDRRDQQLWRGEEAIVLRPKSFAVLRYLLERPGRAVDKEELLQAVWPETAVSGAVLTVCVSELRRALGDEAQAPQYIETVHRRGYRFIGLIRGLESQRPAERPPEALPPSRVVGREAELRQLQHWFAQAQHAQRRVVFVSGEAGIGKTTLVDAFLAQLAATQGLWLARGECVEHYGAGEPYLPVLAALGRLCRAPGGTRLVELLSQQAPTWMVQMPALLHGAEWTAVQGRVVAATQERMLRELAEALEAITAERPLVLVLEDLHWSDYATLDLLAYLGRRRELARLLLVGTYRPVDVIMRAHPLRAVKQDLAVHGQCEEVTLEMLTEAEVGQYLAARLGGVERSAAAFQPLARALHQRTDGQPLFMVTVVNALVRQGVVGEGHWEIEAAVEAVAREVPESLRQVIEQQLEALSPEDQRLLEAASVVGMAWSVTAVAAGLAEESEAVEQRCARLARRGQFLAAHGVEAWPDGTVAGRYLFRHALYGQVVYDRVPMGQCIRLHRQIGARLEAGYGERTAEHAAELALHFERGRDDGRMVRYQQQAAATALQRWAQQEAIGHLTRGLEVLQRLPDTPERTQQELDILTTLGPALIAIKGQGAPEVAQTYARARALCRQIGETPQLFIVLHGLRRFYSMQDEHQTARELGEELLRLAQRQHDPALLREAHHALGMCLFNLGELAAARDHFLQGSVLCDAQPDLSHVVRYGQDGGLLSLSYSGLTLWLLGFPDQALQWSQRAVTLTQHHPHPFIRTMAVNLAAYVSQCRREQQATQAYAEAAIALAREHGFPLWVALGLAPQGWALSDQGHSRAGIALIRQGLAEYQATGSQMAVAYFVALLAEGYLRLGQAEDGLTLVAETLAAARDPGYFFQGELRRLKGELLFLLATRTGREGRASSYSARLAEVEACLRQALDIARRQGAKSLELRAAMSLSRLWKEQGRRDEARTLLADVYGWFTEGFDTADLREARALLQEFGSVG